MISFLTWLGESVGLLPESEETLKNRRAEVEHNIIQFILQKNARFVLYPVNGYHNVHIECYDTSLPCRIQYTVLMKHVIEPHYLKKILYCGEMFRLSGFPEITTVVMPFLVRMLNIRLVKNTEYMAYHWPSQAWRFIESDPCGQYATLDTNTGIVSAPEYKCGIMAFKQHEYLLDGLSFQPPLIT